MFKSQPKGFSTKAIHYGKEIEKWNSAVVMPIYTSTIFEQESPDVSNSLSYGRIDSPTRNYLEKKLAGLENAKYGLTFSSGLGAITGIFSMLSAGDHVIVSELVYSDTYMFLTEVQKRFGISFDFVDMTKIENFKNYIKPNTKMIWIETPSYPTLKLIDIKAISDIAKKYPKIIVAVDNSMLTPYFQKPLELGADLVMYSLSKYINGHSDTLMGAVTTNSHDLYNDLKFIQVTAGAVPSPFDCYQVSRGIGTLKLRMEQHCWNALNVAKYLETNQFVARVLHPGLVSHPQHKLATQQCFGHSGVLSFYLKGDLKTSKNFIKSLKLFTLATSYGGLESLVSLPLTMSHSYLTSEMKTKMEITETLITLSIGLEDFQDIIDDLEQALKYSHM